MSNSFLPDFDMHLVIMLTILLPISSSGSCTPSPSPCTVCNKLLCVVTIVNDSGHRNKQTNKAQTEKQTKL